MNELTVPEYIAYIFKGRKKAKKDMAKVQGLYSKANSIKNINLTLQSLQTIEYLDNPDLPITLLGIKEQVATMREVAAVLDSIADNAMPLLCNIFYSKGMSKYIADSLPEEYKQYEVLIDLNGSEPVYTVIDSNSRWLYVEFNYRGRLKFQKLESSPELRGVEDWQGLSKDAYSITNLLTKLPVNTDVLRKMR